VVPVAHDRATILAALAAELRRAPGEQLTGRTLLGHVLELLPSAESASITARGRRTGYVTLASTDDRAATADQMQYELHEGPCVNVADGADWYRSGDISVDERWPVWGAKAAAELGLRSMLSVRLIGDGNHYGAINVYADGAGLFQDPIEVDLALLVATHAGLALSAAREVTGLRAAVESRHMIGMAQGILMERYELDSERAFALLRRYSNTLNVRLHDIADEVVSTRALPGMDEGRPAGTGE
jgi:GAF domain-containing protein